MARVLQLEMTKLTSEPFVNLVAGIFHGAMHDWQHAYNVIKQLGGEEAAYNQWIQDRELLNNNPALYNTYSHIQYRAKRYSNAMRTIVEIQNFIKSKWFNELCCCIELDPDAVIKEFYDIKNHILKV